MQKKYIYVRESILRDEADNWLLMIPSEKLSSDAKVVYLCLKKIQRNDMSSMTDAHSWKKISGLDFERVKDCLNELENMDLIEQYYSTKSLAAKKRTRTFCAYLLHHEAMPCMYIAYDCPHDNDSFPEPQNADNILNKSRVHVAINKVKEGFERE